MKKAGRHGSEIVEEFFRPIEEHHKEYISLHNNPDYKDVDFDWGNGGLKATHVRHSNLSSDRSRYFGLTPNQLENYCQDILFRLGNSAILCEEGIESVPGKPDTALDLLLNGKRMDISSVTEPKEHYRNNLLGKNHQLRKYNRLPYVIEESDSVCLYFHDPSLFSPEKVTKGFEEMKKMQYRDKETGELKYHVIRIKHIYCVINEGNGRFEVFNVE